jgi:coproporphyrinogen III oxidase-like Fe-S oxidoreductase
LGLRLREGIENRNFPDLIEKFVGDGLLERSSGRVRLTSRGVLLSNEVFAGFLP